MANAGSHRNVRRYTREGSRLVLKVQARVGKFLGGVKRASLFSPKRELCWREDLQL